MKPISPQQALELAKTSKLPDFVIDAFNGLIVKNLREGKATFTQEQAVEAVLAAAERHGKPTSRQEVFSRWWLDVEDLYRAQGWKVDYDTPRQSEAHKAFFVFSTPTSR